MWDPTISVEVEKQEKRLQYLGNKDQAAEEAFRYVLLVPTKVAGPPGTAPKTEINVVPVHDFVLFNKPSVMKMKTLDELDDDFETKMQKDKRKLAEYSKIAKGLSRLSKRDGGRGDGDDDEEDEETGSMLELFGLAANAKLKKGIKKGGNAKHFLSEDGVDLDEQKRVGEMFAGDFEAKFNDNEETYADEDENFAQQKEELNGMAELTKTAAFIKRGNEALSDAESEDPDSEDDDDDDADDADPSAMRGSSSSGGGAGGGSAGGGFGSIDPSSGLTDEGLARLSDKDLFVARISGRALNSAARVQESDKSKAALSEQAAAVAAAAEASIAAASTSTSASATGAGTGPATNNKRKHPDGDGGSGAGAGAGADGLPKKVKFEGEGVGSSSSSSSSNATGPAAVAGGDNREYELTDDGLRRYLTNMGGKVTLDAIKKMFKGQVKALNKSTPSNDAGKNRCVA